jgi:flagellar biosynthesis anti-sigma factor FlgM
MKIWGEVPKVNEVYKTSKVNMTEKVSKVKSKKDVISISNIGKDYQIALKAVKEAPDIRTGKVDEIKEQYASGNYNINGQDIADSIVKSYLDRKV